jgi:ribose 5-phosphate isomerase B
MKIVLGADHAGYELKEALKRFLASAYADSEVIDLGTHALDSVDYPDFAAAVARRVVAERAAGVTAFGILNCGTGVGMSIAANKIRGVRAACVSEPYSAEMARRHNDANVLCVGSRVVGLGLAETIVKAFFAASFEGGRHERRVKKMEGLEVRDISGAIKVPSE